MVPLNLLWEGCGGGKTLQTTSKRGESWGKKYYGGGEIIVCCETASYFVFFSFVLGGKWEGTAKGGEGGSKTGRHTHAEMHAVCTVFVFFFEKFDRFLFFFFCSF